MKTIVSIAAEFVTMYYWYSIASKRNSVVNTLAQYTTAVIIIICHMFSILIVLKFVI